MLGRIRLAMELGSFEKLSGEVESDESFVGGRGVNMHKSKKAKFAGAHEARLEGHLCERPARPRSLAGGRTGIQGATRLARRFLYR
jgi:hypothetical protein